MGCEFVQNRDCPYFPCHEGVAEERFNCLFCFCPLYFLPDCGGNYTLINNKIKDCSNCLIPHNCDNYDYIMSKLSDKLS